jgi:hypothetical protein
MSRDYYEALFDMNLYYTYKDKTNLELTELFVDGTLSKVDIDALAAMKERFK